MKILLCVIIVMITYSIYGQGYYNTYYVDHNVDVTVRQSPEQKLGNDIQRGINDLIADKERREREQNEYYFRQQEIGIERERLQLERERLELERSRVR